jgi:predicted ATPase
MEGKRFLRSIELKNILSYGPEGVKLELEPLNVLIGANATGKSNLLQALRLLKAAPRDIKGPPRWDNSGIGEWMWKGNEGGLAEIMVSFDTSVVDPALSYFVRFHAERSPAYERLMVDEESIFDTPTVEQPEPAPIVRRRNGEANLLRLDTAQTVTIKVKDDESLFSQVRDPSAYSYLSLIGDPLQDFAFFGGWKAGDRLHQAQRADLPSGFLLEDGSNLGLALNDLLRRPGLLGVMVEKLRLIHAWVENIVLNVRGGFVEVTLHEKGLKSAVPASRLSDGTLHFLCLLAILLHPEPPPLVCIEEPELGLHPDAVSALGELLIDASTRTQLIVTTHSDALIASLSEVPEAVVVTEKGDQGTMLRRLEPSKLAEWLEDYRLGDLWRMGELGGNRW